MRQRRPASKGELLLSALLFTAATLIWIYMAFHANANAENYTPLTLAATGGIVVVGSLASAVYWHRWFTYDKK